MVVAGAAPSNPERKQAPSKKLAVLSTVLRTIAGLRKVSIRVLEHFILVPVAQLTLQVRLAVRGGYGGFLFYCTLVPIAVRMFLFWHRP
jgi:hypothetical protein